MRVLICSYAFWPSLGGLELVSENLAYSLTQAGHRVTVLTFSQEEGRRLFPFRIVRSPTVAKQWALFRNADIVISKHLALRCCWPMLVLKKPFLIWHATWYLSDEKPLAKALRRRLLRRSINVANSDAIGRALPRCDAVIHPGYRQDIFSVHRPWQERSSSFAFVGRLAKEKGVDLLLEAMVLLPGHDLTIVGDGPEREALEGQVAHLGLTDRVRFAGRQDSNACNTILNQHRVLAVPSRYEEPFGVVALEGLAAGCHVAVSSGGGLPDAAGPGGEIFEERAPEALANAMRLALNPWSIERENAVAEHLRLNSFEQSVTRLAALTFSRTGAWG